MANALNVHENLHSYRDVNVDAQRESEELQVLLSYRCMRPYATSVCGLKLLVYAALSY